MIILQLKTKIHVYIHKINQYNLSPGPPNSKLLPSYELQLLCIMALCFCHSWLYIEGLKPPGRPLESCNGFSTFEKFSFWLSRTHFAFLTQGPSHSVENFPTTFSYQKTEFKQPIRLLGRKPKDCGWICTVPKLESSHGQHEYKQEKRHYYHFSSWMS